MTASAASEPSRWTALFDDLEAQLAAELRADRDGEIAERTRRERALIALGDRLAGHLGHQLTVDLLAGEALSGLLRDVGSDWVLIEAPAKPAPVAFGAVPTVLLCPTSAVVSVRDPLTRPRNARAARRFGFGAALRVLSRDRVTVAVTLVTGRRVTGTIDVVGADVFDLREHDVDEWHRDARVTARRAVPFHAVSSLTVVGPTSHLTTGS